MPTRFDAAVIGTGQAGPALAARLAGAGWRVAVIERGAFGGTCVNNGCTPTKAMVASAYAAHLARRAADFGVTLSSDAITVDMGRVKARKDAIVRNSSQGVERWLASMKKCTVYRGSARFTGPSTLAIDRVGVDGETVTGKTAEGKTAEGKTAEGKTAEGETAEGKMVEGETIEADRIFINVGGRPLVPDIEGLPSVPYLTSETLMALDRVPAHLVVIGGSYIGLEFGQMFRRFGSEVTIVEMGPRLIGREDADVSDEIAAILSREGIALRLNAKCLSVERDGEGVTVGVSCEDGAPQVHGSDVLLAVGRVPNTDGLGLESAGIAVDARGYITVDDSLRTSVPHVWALGDCNGRGAFTHTAYNDHEIVADNLLSGAQRSVADRLSAYALYTDPPLGRVGASEGEARRAGHRVRIGKRPMTRVARAVEKGETAGFMKVVVDADDDRILGAAILGTGGDEAIHTLVDAMYAQRTAAAFRRNVHIHPTVSELIPTVLGELGEPS